ncbi:MAG: DNA repair protein RecN [Elusimicrobiota bacterium]
MIESFRIKNFALLEKAVVEFGKKFNVITGETGAGKSIMIGALSMVLGERVGREVVRSGKDMCEVEAVLDYKGNREVVDFLHQKDLKDEELIIRRIFYAQGRSKCYVNDHHVTLSTLKELGNLIVDIHSQNQHQALLKRTKQRQLLDRFADNADLLNKISNEWIRFNQLNKRKEELVERRSKTEKEIDRIRHEISEINSAGLRKGLDQEIEKEYRILNNSEKISRGVSKIYSDIYEKEGSLIEQISNMTNIMEEIVNIDDNLREVKDSLDRANFEIEAVSEILRSYIEEMSFNQSRLEEVLELRNKIGELKRKYGNDIEDILGYRDELKESVDQFDDFEDNINEINNKVRQSEDRLEIMFDELTSRRKNMSEKFSSEVNNKLKKLGMADSEFRVELHSKEQGPTGKENIIFKIKTNPGQPEMELSKIASGGEVSRIMLAIKSSLAEADDIPVLVFDEIDSGIGATIAGNVGEELKELSLYHQLIVITHLPQIAGFADEHIKVEKKTEEKVTRTEIKKLDHNMRVSEIARMFGGKKDSISSQQAKEVLKKR